MPTVYDPPTDDVLDVLRAQLTRYHPDIVECGAKVGVIMARNETGPAVKLHGTAAFAKVRIVSADKKVNNENDAEIIIDASEWDQLLPAQRDSLINHECHHLRRKEHKDKKLAKLRAENPDCPAWVIDHHGRPVLGTVPADLTPGDVFLACVEIHGKNAIEFVGIKRAWQQCEEAVQGADKAKD